MRDISPPLYIDTKASLEAWIGNLRGAQVVGVDTESDSFHHYREKVCLIQMTADGVDAVIDPLALDDLSGLGEFFSDAGTVKIFHDACYDLICLARDFGFQVRGIFDTMVASRLLGWRQFGLATILREHFNFESDKRLQRSDWAQRPLTPEQIAYARFDTHFLPSLTTLLTEKLGECGRLPWALEDFQRLPEIANRIPQRHAGPDTEGFWRVRGIKTLSPRARGRVRALYLLRERIAERLDRPPFKVFNDAVLVEIATQPPQTLRDLQPRPGLRRGGIERFGREIMEVLNESQPIVEPPPPNTARRRSGRFLDPGARQLYEELRNLRRDKADELGLEPEVVLGNATLETIARGKPRSTEEVLTYPELRGWRQPYLADAIVDVVAGARGLS